VLEPEEPPRLKRLSMGKNQTLQPEEKKKVANVETRRSSHRIESMKTLPVEHLRRALQRAGSIRENKKK
jgi:hypothetical protein